MRPEQEQTEARRRLRCAPWLRVAGSFGLSLLAALAVSAGAMRLCGVPVWRSYAALFEGSMGEAAWRVETILKATPLVLIALGMAVAVRGGVWNVGGDGQFLMGAAAAGLLGLSLPPDASGWALPAVLLAGVAGGAAWAAGPGLLRARLGANEIILTVMLNYVAAYLVLFLVQGPLKHGYLPESAPLPIGAAMPVLWQGTRLHAGIAIALAAVAAAALVLRFTTAGFELRAVGLDAHAAYASGLRVRHTQVLAFTISGALAGLAGAVELTATYGRLCKGMCPGYGFLGLAIAILARSTAEAVVPVALLFGALLVGGGYAERSVGTPKDVIFVVQGSFLLAFAAVEGWLSRKE